MTEAFPISLPLAAAAAASSYAAPPTWVAARPGQVMNPLLGSVRAVRTKVDGLTVIAVPGTDSVSVFLVDLMTAKVEMADHRELGRLHHGFSAAATALAMAIDLGEDESYVLVGHSFGGAVAQLLAMILPHPPVAILGLAPARPFADSVPQMVLDLTLAYRFGNDPVPEQPGWFVSVPCQPIGASMERSLDCHHVANYVAALSSDKILTEPPVQSAIDVSPPGPVHTASAHTP